MCVRRATCTVAICLFASAVSVGQNVEFQIVPFPGTPINPALNPVVVVEPGTLVPFEVLVEALSDDTFPTAAGVATFDFDVVTDLGVAQTTLFAFAPTASPLFTVNQSFGTAVFDDVRGIAGGQNLGTASNINTGFAVNTPQVLGTGQLLTPSFEGTFGVNLLGSADLFNVDPTLSTVPALVGASPGFTVVTRFPTSTTTTQPSGTPTTQPSGNGGTGTSTISGGPSGPGPTNDNPSGEQVAGEIPDGPPLTSTMTGMCGFGAVSAMGVSLLGLTLLSLGRLRVRSGRAQR